MSTIKIIQPVVIVGVFSLVGTLLLAFSLASEPTQSGEGVSATVYTSTSTLSDTTSQLRTAITLTQNSLDQWGDATAVASGKALLEDSTDIVAQHMHGFGGVFPRLSDGSYDWTALDRRFNVILSGVDDQVLTACCAPAYMEEPKDGETDTGNYSPYRRPKPEYYDEYAEAVLQAVQRYPNIKYIQVWNEMKGFWNPTLNRWDNEAFTAFYNEIWNTVKPVRPDIMIGGPYVVLNSNGTTHSYDSTVGGSWGLYDQRDLDTITYWLQNKAGADFLTVDGKNHNKDGIELVDQFERTNKFGVFADWFRNLDETTYPDAQTLPIWWAEWYARTSDDLTTTQAEKNATMATGLIRTLRSGAETAIIWGPQGDVNGDYHPLALFNDTQIVGGGQATPFHATQKYFHDYFSAGTRYADSGITNTNVESILSDNHLLMVNMTNANQAATVAGQNYTLSGYEVRLENVADTLSPLVGFTTSDNTLTNTNIAPLEVDASDPNGIDRVEFYVDGALVHSATSAPYSFDWDVSSATYPNRNYTLSSIAFDSAGNSQISTQIIAIVRLPDISRNGTVDIFDLSRLLSKWNTNNQEVDLNNNNVVDIFDLSTLLGKWGA